MGQIQKTVNIKVFRVFRVVQVVFHLKQWLFLVLKKSRLHIYDPQCAEIRIGVGTEVKIEVKIRKYWISKDLDVCVYVTLSFKSV